MKRYVAASSQSLSSERKQAFLRNVAFINSTGDFDKEVRKGLQDIDDTPYFSFSEHASFYDVVNSFNMNSEDKEEYVDKVDYMLVFQHGASVDNPTYEVSWGAEPMYLTLSDSGTIILIDHLNYRPAVYTLKNFLADMYPGNVIPQIEMLSDVEVAMRHMKAPISGDAF